MVRHPARAIMEGRPYRFSIQPGSGDFRTAPDAAEFWSGGDAPAATDSGRNAPLVVQDSLPRGVRFATIDATDSSYFGNLGMSDAGDASSSSSGAWSTVAVFLPDGSAQQDVEITFRSPDSGPIALRLRALTGGMSTRWVPANESR